MNRLIIITVAFLSVALNAIPAATQNLLNNPESVVFDSPRNRYLVSNWENQVDGSVVEIDSLGQQSLFADDLIACAGMQIIGDTLYVACTITGLKAYNLVTGEQILDMMFPNQVALNDITTDGQGNLYITDYYNGPGRIYKMRVADHSVEVLVDNIGYGTNGHIYDPTHHRLLVLSVGTRQILGVDLETLDVSTLAQHPALTATDGIAIDGAGTIYFTDWTTDAIWQYEQDFTGLTPFATNLNDPADLYFDAVNNLLAVANFSSHTVDFIPLEPTAVADDIQTLPVAPVLLQNYPNPFTTSSVIRFQLPTSQTVHLAVYNATGQLIKTLASGNRTSGQHAVTWDGTDSSGQPVSSGVYLYRLTVNGRQDTQRMVLSK